MIPNRKILVGDCRETLKQLPDNSVHCVVTSPPYFQLRAYGDDSREMGREKTPQEFVSKMVALFREVRRVLRKDGVCWVNIGDSYNNSGRSGGDPGNGTLVRRGKTNEPAIRVSELKPKDMIGIPWMLAFALRDDGWYLRCDCVWNKPNPMPESVADRPTKSHEYIFLLTKSARYFYDAEAILESCSDNTHLRISQNVAAQIGSERANGGAKTNGNMKAVVRKPNGWHNAENYHNTNPVRIFDGVNPKAKQDQVGKRQYDGFNDRWKVKQNESFTSAIRGPIVSKRNKRSVWDHDDNLALMRWLIDSGMGNVIEQFVSESRKKGDVWTIPTAAFSDAHFATFPPDLIKPCVMAGASEGGCCKKCGSPRERIIEKGEPDIEHQKKCGGDQNGEYYGESKKDYSGAKAQNASATKARILEGMREKKTVDWKKTCKCETTEVVPCTVLDPFAGSGTTGEVAGELGRDFIGCELYEKFLPMIERRTAEPGLAFT